jgi:indoleamine 2,3-dioxygenase
LLSDKSMHAIRNQDLVDAVRDAGRRAGAQHRVLIKEVKQLVEEKERTAKLAKSEANSRGMLGEEGAWTVHGSIGCDGVG